VVATPRLPDVTGGDEHTSVPLLPTVESGYPKRLGAAALLDPADGVTRMPRVILALAVAALLVPGVIAALKARWRLLALGIVLRLLLALNPRTTATTDTSFANWLGFNFPAELPWLIATARLARPYSFWGRRYSAEKRARSLERFAGAATTVQQEGPDA